MLHIVAEEAKIFRTKERCPLMLLIECYRPAELALEKVPSILAQSGSGQVRRMSARELEMADRANQSMD